MQDSEILNTFNDARNDFRPYGLTCEVWKPDLMRKADRHNEIEINYIAEGSITYLFQDSKIEIPAQSFTVFWGLVPHQIVDHTHSIPYFVGTIPLTLFLEWKLPAPFVDKVFRGEILIDDRGEHSGFDEYMIKNWLRDFSMKSDHTLILLEMQARLLRMAERMLPLSDNNRPRIYAGEISKVE